VNRSSKGILGEGKTHILLFSLRRRGPNVASQRTVKPLGLEEEVRL